MTLSNLSARAFVHHSRSMVHPLVRRRANVCLLTRTRGGCAIRSASTLLGTQEDAAARTSTSLPVLACLGIAAAAAGASALWTAAGSPSPTSVCESAEQQTPQHPKNKFQRFYSSKYGCRNPMTSYQKYADEQEHKEEVEEQLDLEYRKHQKEEQEQIHPHAAGGSSVPPSSTTHKDDCSCAASSSSNSDTSLEAASAHAVETAIRTMQATSVATPNTQPVDMTAQTTMTQSEARIEEATRKAKQHSGGLKIFSGNGNMSLSLEIARHLGVNLGKATVGRFADGEVNVVIHENVRGKDVYVVQPTGPPVNDNIMELLLMTSTLRRSSARRITVVIPYYGYARQDRKMQARVPISAADVARLMESMGVDRVIAVDLHCGQIQGFFGPRVPVDNLDGGIVGLDYFGCKDLHNPVVVSPDAGGVYRAKKFKEGLESKYDMQDLGLAMIVKQRARAGSVDQMDLVGDVRDCDCIIVDDMIDTAGTLCKAADVLVANGARRVFAFASHGLLSGPGNERIANSAMEEVVILNTLPTSPQREANEKLSELSVAPLLAQAIFNIHAKKSISALFK